MYSILCVINGLAFFLFAFVSDYDMAQKLNLDTKTFLMKMFMGSINIGIQNKRSILDYFNPILHKQGQMFIQFLPIFFILTWIDEFGNNCKRFESQNVEDHITKCLGQYNYLQNGLGKNV